MALKTQHQSDITKLEWPITGKCHARAAKIGQITHKTVPKVP